MPPTWTRRRDEARTHAHDGRYRDAARAFREARRLYRGIRTNPAKFDPIDAEMIIEEGNALMRAAAYDEALDLLAPVVPAIDAHADPRDALVVRAHLVYGTTLSQKGRTDEGIAHFEACRRAIEAGADVPDTTRGTVLNNLASGAYMRGDLDGAIEWIRRALEHLDKTVGPDHPDVTRPLQNLAWMHAEASRIGEADRYTARLLEIAPRAYPADHPRMGSILATVASVHYAAGRFVDAANAYERAFELLDPDDQRLVPDRQNLAAMYTTLGDLASATRHAEAALRQVEERLDPRHPKRLDPWRSLARVEALSGRVDEALARMDRVLEIEREIDADPNARFLDRWLLAEIGNMEGNAERAEPAARDALELLGAGARDVPRNQVHVLVELARAQLSRPASGGATGAGEAVATLREAADVAERAGALDHGLGRDVLALLAEALEATGDADGARHASERLLASTLASRREVFALLDDVGRRRDVQRHLDAFERLLAAPADAEADDVERWIGLWLTHRHAASFAAAAMLRWRAERDAEDRRLLDDYRAALRRSAGLGLGDDDASSALRDRLATLEAQLGRRNLAAIEEAVAPIDVATVAARLALDERLLDVAWLPGAVVGIEVRPDGSWCRAVLGRPDELETAVERLRVRLDPRNAPTDAERERTADRALTERLLGPFLAPGREPARLWIAADGALTRIPWSRLAWRGASLGARTEVAHVASPRAFVRRPSAAAETPAAPSLLLGDPDFGAEPAASPASEGAAWRGAATVGEHADAPPYRAWLRQLRMPRLHRSRDEVEMVRALLPDARVLTGSDATVAALLGARRPRVLHVASHAFLYPGRELDAAPLLRPVLALAGARTVARAESREDARAAVRSDGRSDARRDAPSDADGANAPLPVAGAFLPALAMMGLDLDGTDLVVLSACGTSLGETLPGEGVAGMAHALQAAGARYVVASLWPVPDDAAVEVMRVFYGAYAAGTAPPAALRRAQDASVERVAEAAAAFVCWG